MKHLIARVAALAAAFALAGSALAQQNPKVEMKTSRGTLQIELYADKARRRPATRSRTKPPTA